MLQSFSSSEKEFNCLSQHFLHSRMEHHLETSKVWTGKYFQETRVPVLHIWHSSSIWKTSKTDSLPTSLTPNHLIILKKKKKSLQQPPLSAANYYNHLRSSSNCIPKKFCCKSNFSYFYMKNVQNVCIYIHIHHNYFSYPKTLLIKEAY